MILYADKETIVAKILSGKNFVSVGLISYSAYLWHQPLFAFARIKVGYEPTKLVMALLALASMLLAFFSFKFIEKPFRAREGISSKIIFSLSLFGLASFIVIGSLGHFGKLRVLNHDAKSLIQTSEAQAAHEDICNIQSSILRLYCRKVGDVTAKPTTLILGDSHAGAMVASIGELLYESQKSALIIRLNGCTPIKNVSMDRPAVFERCINLNQEVYENLIPVVEFENIILISRWTAHWTGTPFDNQEGGVESWGNLEAASLAGISDLGKTTNKTDIAELFKKSIYTLSDVSNLILVYPIPEAGWSVPNALNASLIAGNLVTDQTLSTSSVLYDLRNKEIISLFDSFEYRIRRVNPKEIFCDAIVEDRCVTVANQKPLYYDDDHLSKIGADFLREAIIDALK